MPKNVDPYFSLTPELFVVRCLISTEIDSNIIAPRHGHKSFNTASTISV